MLVNYQNAYPKVGGVFVNYKESNPVLPPYTIRLKYRQGTTPSFSKGTGELVDSTNNIWDLTYENTDWSALLLNQYHLIEIINANTTNVTNMNNTFAGCQYLTTVQLFDTSNVGIMHNMFLNCNSLTIIPLFDTSKVTIMGAMFYNCYNVQSGALALYQQASTQTNPPSEHWATFRGCGEQTTSGAAELTQIPDDWK